jgi:hypothetical protein
MEKQFLIDDLKIGEAWRLFKILGEFVEGVEALHDLGPAVSVFGSARVKREDPIYAAAAAGSWRQPTKGQQRQAAHQ